MPATPDSAGRGHFKAVAAILQTLVLAAAVAYIVWTLAGQWQALKRHAWTLRPGHAVLSLPLAAVWFLCRAWLWQRILQCFGYPLAYRRAFRTFILSELARYLPGSVWHVLGRSYLAARQGVPAAVALTGVVLEMALVALSALAFVPLRAVGSTHLVGGITIWAAAAVLLLVVFAHPRAIMPLLNAILRRLKKPPVPGELRYRDLFAMLALCALMWVSLCLGFVLLAASVAPAAARSPVAVAASFPVAWFVGLIAVTAPGGLGVREGVLAALLSGLLAGGMGVVVSLVSRIWLTGAELLCAAVAWRIRE